MKNYIPAIIIAVFFAVSCKPREIAHSNPVDKYEIPATDPSAYESKTPSSPQTTPAPDPGGEAITDDNFQPPQVTLEPLDVPDSLLASIQRTACYGSCPVYTFKIYNSGFAEYEGVHFVDSVGNYTTQVPEERLRQLKELVNETNYFSYEDKYIDPYIVDIPTTITIVQMDGRLKRILNGHDNTPEGLVIFEKFLDGVVQELGFTHKPRREE